MKLLFALCFALAAAMAFGQVTDQSLNNNLAMNQLLSYGTGVVLVPIDRAAITVTAMGMDTTAAGAVRSANDLQGRINDTLKNYTIIDIRNGGLYLQPLYTGSSLSFAAHASLSIVINAADTPAIIDSMVSLGVSNISFIFTPDFFAVERAQRQSLQLAVADALFKAQAVLDTIGHCAMNISRVAIRNPALELPTLTFNIFANMGNMNSMSRLNFGGNRQQQGSGFNNQQQQQGNINQQQQQQQGNNLNLLNSSPMMLGAAAPLLEGDREEIVSYVELYISHVNCATGGSGMMQDITSSLDLSNIVGIAGGSLQGGSALPVSSPISSVGSFSGSGSGSGMLGNRPVRSTAW